jgi:hypothetical protein
MVKSDIIQALDSFRAQLLMAIGPAIKKACGIEPFWKSDKWA